MFIPYYFLQNISPHILSNSYHIYSGPQVSSSILHCFHIHINPHLPFTDDVPKSVKNLKPLAPVEAEGHPRLPL